jgi:hypothetical protein
MDRARVSGKIYPRSRGGGGGDDCCAPTPHPKRAGKSA